VVLGYQDFQFGGGYMNFGDSNTWKGASDTDDRYSWNLGAQYAFDALTVGVGYNYQQKDVNYGSIADNDGKKQSEAFTVGAGYAVAKGLDVYANYGYVKTKNTYSNISDDANVVSLSANVSF